ncbi:NAD+ synthase [Candidatus Peregrinibacteria bacterium]|nr:NAD+ synthase [Candidatus Peregrinibacteria bacterium]
MEIPIEPVQQTAQAPKIPAVQKPAAGQTQVAQKIQPRISSLDQIYEALVNGLKKYFADRNFKRGALGLSGGVDSSLTLKIAADALGAENVTALLMPELGLTKQENIDHSKLLCQFFGVNCFYQPINNFLTDFSIVPWRPSALAHMNTKARVRAVLLYNYANTENALVLGTSNKSELLLGYGTKYGDLAADVEVIGDLYKTEVVALADHVGLPPEIVNKTPSAELAPGQTDEEEIGATYKDMDKVLMKLQLGATPEECVAHGLLQSLVQLVDDRIKQNKHKSELPLVIQAH